MSLSQFPAQLPAAVVEDIAHFLEARALRHRDTALGAAIENQLPFLTSWTATVLLPSLQLECALAALAPKGVLAGSDLPPFLKDQLARYCALHQLPFDALDPAGPASRGVPSKPRPKPFIRLRTQFEEWRPRGSKVSGGAEHTRLIAISLQPNSTRAFLPVAMALQRHGISTRFVLACEDAESQAQVQKSGLPFVTTTTPFHPRPLSRSVRSLPVVREVGSESSAKMLLSRLPFPASTSPALLAPGLARLFRLEMLRSVFRAEAINDTLARVSGDAFVFITHRALLNSLLKQLHPGAKRVFFLQGIVPDFPPVFARLDVDLALLGSRIDARYAQRCSIPTEARRFVGYPDYAHFKTLDKERCRQRVAESFPHWKMDRSLFVFGSQYRTPMFSDNARLMNLNAVVAAARALPGAFFVIKLHPRRENLDPDFVARLPGNVSVANEFDTPTLIKAANVFITYWSTTALEAILLDTPLVQLNATGLPDFFPLSEQVSGETAHDERELIAALQRTKADATRNYARFVASLGLDDNEQAPQKCARFIRELWGH